MRQIVMIASLLSITLSFNACCSKDCIQYVNVPQKCIIPKVQEPIIDNDVKYSNADIVAKALKNYTTMQEYAEKLLASQEVCK